MAHAERAHAIYAPSSAHRWIHCTASAEGIAQLGEQESGEAAEAGTEAHAELERVLKGEPADTDHPAAYSVALAVSYIHQLPAGKMWVEQRVELTPHVWGRCDVAHWHAESATLTIVDLKQGFVDVPAEENEPLQIYAAASIFTHNLPAKYIRLVIVQPNSLMPVPRVKQWVTDADALYTFAKRVAAIPVGHKEFSAGEHCKYCPLFGLCPASQDVLTQLGTALASQPEQVPLAQRAIFKAMEKPISDWFKGADKKWTAEALKGAVPPGMKLVTSQTRRAWKNEAEARAFVLERKGVDALDPPTPAQAEKLGLDISGLAEAPPGAPVLAFDSDKRAPWASKSAAEMFAGVTGK